MASGRGAPDGMNTTCMYAVTIATELTNPAMKGNVPTSSAVDMGAYEL